MNAEEYWRALCAKNSKLAEREGVTLKVTGLKAMVKQAHEKGVKHAQSATNPFFDLFGNGKRK